MLAPFVQPDLALLVSGKILGGLGGSRLDFLYNESWSEYLTAYNTATNLIGLNTLVVVLLQCLQMKHIVLVALPLSS